MQHGSALSLRVVLGKRSIVGRRVTVPANTIIPAHRLVESDPTKKNGNKIRMRPWKRFPWVERAQAELRREIKWATRLAGKARQFFQHPSAQKALQIRKQSPSPQSRQMHCEQNPPEIILLVPWKPVPEAHEDNGGGFFDLIETLAHPSLESISREDFSQYCQDAAAQGAFLGNYCHARAALVNLAQAANGGFNGRFVHHPEEAQAAAGSILQAMKPEAIAWLLEKDLPVGPPSAKQWLDRVRDCQAVASAREESMALPPNRPLSVAVCIPEAQLAPPARARAIRVM